METPLIRKSKAEIIRLGIKLKVPYESFSNLKDVIKKPMPGADIELATKILMQRNTLAN